MIVVSVVALLAAFAVAARATPAVGIRLVFTEQNMEGASCTNEEHNTVVEIMHDGILDLMEEQESRFLQTAPVRAPVRTPVRVPVKAPVKPPVKPPVRAPVRSYDDVFKFDDGLSDVTDPSFCKAACAGYAPGSCFV